MPLLRKLLGRLFPSPDESMVFPDIDLLRVQPLPSEYWIELTSMCPFDCVFCSRAALRGKGEHMDFGTYENLITQMQNPTLIRLNYSGESIHYPQLGEAIALAKKTGARVELVTALSSAKPKIVEALVKEGLDRLTISIHALEESVYQSIYGFSSVNSLHENLLLLQNYKQAYGTHKPVVDFAFVAMERNLNQLELVASLAVQMAVQQIDIHPVIRRDEIPEVFARELIAGSLSVPFRARLVAALQQVSDLHPQLNLNVSNKEVESTPCLGEVPAVYPDYLPEGARIYSCEQNPWGTIHVLANGDLVTCEVRDQIVMGNLQSNNLADIWNGEIYTNFRQSYVVGKDEKCRSCVYKQAYQPQAIRQLKSYLKPIECPHQLIRGWHEVETNFVWSSMLHSSAVVGLATGKSILVIRGRLPPEISSHNKTLSIIVGEQRRQISNLTDAMLDFVVEFPLHAMKEKSTVVDFQVSSLFSPEQAGSNIDARPLGFVLSEIKCQ